MALSLWSGASPASAQGCYPPPCGAPAPVVTVADSSAQPDASLISAPSGADRRTAVPFVAAGLLMITGSLSVICIRRRAAMAAASRVEARTAPAVSPRAASSPAGAYRMDARRSEERQRQLRGA